jgi:hypothetical protein
MEKICVNKLTRNSANQRPSSSWGLIDKTNLQVVTCKFPKCTSTVQVSLQITSEFLQVNFTKCRSALISVLCLAVILTVKFGI